jgi:hypothetical protein
MNVIIFIKEFIPTSGFKKEKAIRSEWLALQQICSIKSYILHYLSMLFKFKKILFITILLVFVPHAFAPVPESFTILYSTPVNPYKELIYAIGMTETKCDTMAYNAIEEAVGFFQIRPIRVEDYNKRTGSKYKPEDMYDYETAEKVFLYYAGKIGPYNFEKIARNWNGSGIRTYYYWNRVKQYL